MNEDPYSIHGINDIDPDIDLRAAAKLLLLTAINAETPEKAFGFGAGAPVVVRRRLFLVYRAPFYQCAVDLSSLFCTIG